MIDEVFADARKVCRDRDAMLPQLISGADAGKHQQLRRHQRARREYDVGVRQRRLLGTIRIAPCHTARTPALDDDPANPRLQFHGEPLVVLQRRKESVGR